MEGLEEERLLARGDTEAFRELFEAHYRAIFRFAYRLTGATDVAEDITQECFVRLMRRPAFDRRRGSLRQYLYGIVRNLVRQQQEAAGREVQWDDNVDDECSPAIVAYLDPLACSELTAVVQAAISALPPLQREAIVLFEFEQLSLEETAAVVGCDIGTIKSRLHRARERLRRSLSPFRNYAQMPVPKGTKL
jgi:RNA polymerase sigma-70 factor, ECF subfamily